MSAIRKGEPTLELIYLVDRTLTRFIQSIANYIEKKTKIPIGLQSAILVFPAILLAVITKNQFSIKPKDTPFSNLLFFVYIGLLLLSLELGRVVGFLIKWLHSQIDPERYLEEERDYSPGYVAWGLVAYATPSLFMALYIRTNPFAESFWYLGFYALCPHAYIEFARRRKFDSNKRKQKVSEALRKLVDKCRSWLPVPKPAPV